MPTQDPNDILSAINLLAQTVGNTSIPNTTIPPLNFTVPTGLDAKFREFLDRASKDPDIIKYYQQLLDYAKGDTNLAKSQLERDYKVGVRQTTDTLGNTLSQMGLGFGKEQTTLEDTLNKRGIAMTDMGGGKVAYAGGGQPSTELGQLNESQKLRQEAEQRSASQKIEGLGINREKGITNANQALRNTALDLQSREKQDVYNRANMNFGAFQAKQASDAQQKFWSQQNPSSSNSSGMTDAQKHINPQTGVWDDNFFAQTYG